LLSLVVQVQPKPSNIVKGGAGFGKTLLAVGWVDRLQQSGNLIAWVALDAENNEPTRFLLCVTRLAAGALVRV